MSDLRDRTFPERIAICETIPGYSGMEMLERLYEQARDAEPDGMNVEIGCLFGRSSVAIARGLQDRDKGDVLTCIDPFTSWPGEEALRSYQAQFGETPKELAACFKGHMVAAEAKNFRHVMARSDSASASKAVNGAVRFAFIDGDHRKDAVLNDVQLILPHLVEGSVVVFDDYGHNRGTWAVAEIVDELVRPISEPIYENMHGCVFFRIGGAK